MRTFLTLTSAVLALGALTAFSVPSTTALNTTATNTALAVHCQVPCGIYGDRMRIDMLREDAATIEKAMGQLLEMDAEESPSKNQMVRWVVTKEEHAQKIQDQVAAYWLAQRIKSPAADADDAARAKYHAQLAALHHITVAAMKCKQTTDVANVEAVRAAALELSELYFSAEDLEHIRGHHKGDDADRGH